MQVVINAIDSKVLRVGIYNYTVQDIPIFRDVQQSMEDHKVKSRLLLHRPKKPPPRNTPPYDRQ
jgi:hypothetical protein